VFSHSKGVPSDSDFLYRNINQIMPTKKGKSLFTSHVNALSMLLVMKEVKIITISMTETADIPSSCTCAPNVNNKIAGVKENHIGSVCIPFGK